MGNPASLSRDHQTSHTDRTGEGGTPTRNGCGLPAEPSLARQKRFEYCAEILLEPALLSLSELPAKRSIGATSRQGSHFG